MTRKAARRAAASVKATAVRGVRAEPTARGADWRSATVASIGTDGTITTTDGIPARRMEKYTTPAIGDLIHISRSGNGNWRAEGRMAQGIGGWTTLPMASGWAPFSGYFAPSYRVLGADAASLRGVGSFNGALSNGGVIATLPTVARPAFKVRATVQVATGFWGVMTIQADGTIILNDFTSGLPTSGNKFAEFDVFATYSLA